MAGRGAGAVRLRARVQLPVAARDRGGYGQPGRVAAGPPPHGHTPAWGRQTRSATRRGPADAAEL